MREHPAISAFRGGDRLVRVVGHRGARGILPENSMLGFEFAIKSGAPLLEFDVVLTADEIPVITHNHRLHAATFRSEDGQFITAEPKVAELHWSQLSRYDIGRLDVNTLYAKRFPDQAQLDGIRVPRLVDLLDFVNQPAHHNAYLMLELKSDPDFALDQNYRQKFVRIVVQLVRQAGLARRTVLHSFAWNLLQECREQAPDIPASFLTHVPKNVETGGEESSQSICPNFAGRESEIPDLVAKSGGAFWCPYAEDLTGRLVARAHELGLVVVVWTVNDIAEIDRVVEAGVDAIVTDYPGRVQRRLTELGYRWQNPEHCLLDRSQ